MTAQQLATATRFVWLARWMAERDDKDGYYSLTLSCGHMMRCSEQFLRHSILCTQCVETSQPPHTV